MTSELHIDPPHWSHDPSRYCTVNMLLAHGHNELSASLAAQLSRAGHRVITVHDMTTAIELAQQREFDALVIDHDLSDDCGLQTCREIRSELRRPAAVVMTTAEACLDSTLRSFAMGADDHLAYPFEVAELQARLKAILRARRRSGHRVLSVGNLTLDLDTCSVFIAGAEVVLTRVEFALLRALAEKSPALVTLDELRTELWPERSPRAASLYVQVYHLRRRLAHHRCPQTILTVQGRGYRLVLR